MRPDKFNLLVLAISAALIIASAIVYSSGLKCDIELISADDPHKIFRYTVVTIVLKNRESFDIEPVFFINNGVDKKPWKIAYGPKSLRPGEEAIYVIETPSAEVAIMAEQEFIIEIRDVRTGLSKFSRFKLPSLAFPGIRNPEFFYWSYNFIKNEYSPFAWDPTWWTETEEEASVRKRLDGNVVYLAVWNLTRKSGDWLMSGIQQVVDLPEKLRIVVKPMSATQVSQYPVCVVGIEIADGDKRLWVLFTDEVTEPMLLKRYGELSHALYFVPIKVGEWNEVIVDVKSVYKQMNWEIPPETLVMRDGVPVRIKGVNLLAFTAMYPGCEHEKLEAYYSVIESES